MQTTKKIRTWTGDQMRRLLTRESQTDPGSASEKEQDHTKVRLFCCKKNTWYLLNLQTEANKHHQTHGDVGLNLLTGEPSDVSHTQVTSLSHTHTFDEHI